MKTLGLAALAAFTLTATSAMAGGYWQNGTYYTYPSTVATTQSTTTYSAPSTTVVGSVGPIQSAGTVTYSQPTYVAPATTGTIYTNPVTPYIPPATNTYVAPSTTYTVPTYTTPSYTATTNSYVPPTTTYTPVPRVAPAPPVIYDGRDRVRDRIRNQRNRIERALDRGELRRGEERRLREGLREIRRTFRSYRDNDGYVGRHEEAHLMQMLNRHSKRIRRLANNNRVAGGFRYGPYAY